MTAKPAELILSLAVSALGIATAIGTAQLPSAGGYARIGPNVAPAVIAGGLILLGIWLLFETFTGGWRNAVRTIPRHAASMPSIRALFSGSAPASLQRSC